MKRPAIFLLALLVLFSAAVVWGSQKDQKKINFSGNWVIQNIKGSSPQAQQGGGRGMGRVGGYPRGGYPGGGRTGGGGRQSGGRQTGGADDATGIIAPLSYSLLVIDHSETALKLTYRSGDTEGQNEFIETFKLDGSESANAGFGGSGQIRTRTTWDKDKLVTLGTQQTSSSDSAASEVVIKQELSLSKNGKTLTVKTTRTANGRSVTMEQTYVPKAQASK
jgi:hypothetical protein